MGEIEKYELEKRRVKLMAQYQHYQASIDNRSSGNAVSASPAVGHIAGRSVTQVDSASSKEAQIYQKYLLSPVEDQILSNYVNTTKKTETHLHGSLAQRV